jgi:hypothetical protein
MRLAVFRSAGNKGLLRRAAATTAGLLLATMAAAGVTSVAPTARASARAVTQPAHPPYATVSEVEAALGVKPDVPTLFVFLVDTSDSMQSDGMYGAVETQLPLYLQGLAENDPTDEVVVLPVENPVPGGQPLQPLYGPTFPTRDVTAADLGLPPTAHGGTTDYGQSFSAALDQFSTLLPKGIEAGVVVLLSDGQPDEADDAQYNGPASDPYNTPAWRTLRTRAEGLSIPVLGFAVPLTSRQDASAAQQTAAAQETALSQVFYPVEKATDATALSSQLQEAQAHIVDGEVAYQAHQDSNQGVQVTWSGLPTALNLQSAGQRDVTVTLTALTQKVPLYLSDLKVSSSLASFQLSGVPAGVTLDPGKPVPITLGLRWAARDTGLSLKESTSKLSGRLTLTATVGSAWGPALLDFHDGAFSLGTLHGNVSSPITATASATDILWYLIAFVLLLIAAALLWLFLIRLRGTLTLAFVDDLAGRPFPLPPRPMTRTSTDHLLGIPGRMTVRRSLRSRRMKVKLKFVGGRPNGEVMLKPGGTAIAGGIHITHARKR